jgi:hypothetical protein
LIMDTVATYFQLCQLRDGYCSIVDLKRRASGEDTDGPPRKGVRLKCTFTTAEHESNQPIIEYLRILTSDTPN